MAPPKRQSVAAAAPSTAELDDATKDAFLKRQSGRGSRASAVKATAAIASKYRTIPNSSSDPASDLLLDESTTLIKKETPSKSRMTFVGVNIPTSKSRLAMYSEETSSIDSRENKRFKDEISDTDMNDDDTPATSMAPTPAEPAKNTRKRALSNAVASVSPLNPSKRAKTKTENLLSDASLALKLQASEYDDRTGFIDDSQSSGAETSDGLRDGSGSDSDMSDFVIESRKRTSNQRKKAAKKAQPRRAAKITDTDDELDSDDLEVIKKAEEESVFDSDALSDAPSDLSALSDTEAPARTDGRVRNRRPANATRRIRRRRGMDMEERAQYERERLETAHPELKTLWEDLAAVPRITPVQADQPVHISRQLKSFQREGLDWMIKQEQSSWRGGLLGDEMGMGKTIQAVSLIMSDYPAKSPSLVVVPPVALVQWASEIKEYTSGKLKVLIHHNTDTNVKKLKMADLMKYDVIMISYSGLESMHRKEIKGWKRDDHLVKENSKIHAIKFHRLILDEAHSIKSRTTGVAKACFALKADFKWCLSGTPVQNRIGEFFSLLRFLDVKPFACYFCKACDCKQLHWQQDSSHKCTSCQHSGFNHVSIFNQELLNPLTQNADPEIRKDAMRKLRLLTDRLMLRRLKRDHTSSMELPPKDIIIHNEFFGHIERDFSSSIMSNTTRQFDTYVSRGVMLNNYANIFGLIMQMRQVANHPDLILKKHAHGGQNVLVCCICDEVAEEPIRSRCKHEFCRKCVRDFVNSFEGEIGDDGEPQEPDCPRCHIRLAIDWEQPDIEQDEDNVQKNSIVNRIKMEDWTSSTKIEMLIYDLYKLRSKKQTHKSIVFSQFTSMLQLVEWRLRRAGFNTVMLDGSMSIAQRSRSIDYFMKNVDVEVFLVSLKAGGVALNLTEASRVFIIDPWWNPAAEWQSADRCHRIGQKRPCVITRLCIEDSVESRMVMLQEKKANMINGTINNDDVAMEKLTPEDMQFLFRGA